MISDNSSPNETSENGEKEGKCEKMIYICIIFFTFTINYNLRIKLNWKLIFLDQMNFK